MSYKISLLQNVFFSLIPYAKIAKVTYNFPNNTFKLTVVAGLKEWSKRTAVPCRAITFPFWIAFQRP